MTSERSESDRVDILRGGGKVTVCDACGRPECWEGLDLCEDSRTAGTREVDVKDLPQPQCPHCGADGWHRCPEGRELDA